MQRQLWTESKCEKRRIEGWSSITNSIRDMCMRLKENCQSNYEHTVMCTVKQRQRDKSWGRERVRKVRLKIYSNWWINEISFCWQAECVHKWQWTRARIERVYNWPHNCCIHLKTKWESIVYTPHMHILFWYTGRLLEWSKNY